MQQVLDFLKNFLTVGTILELCALILAIIALIFRKNFEKLITKHSWLIASIYVCLIIISLYALRDSFMLPFFSCFYVLFGYKIIEDSVDKGVNIFTSLSDNRLYYLSFVYKDGYELITKNGLSKDETQKILQKKFNEGAFPFMIRSADNDINNPDIKFVGEVISNKELLYKYVITPLWGKKQFNKLVSVMKLPHDHQEVDFAMTVMLTEDEKDNKEQWIQIFPMLFSRPFFDPERKGGEISAGENMANVFILSKELKIIDMTSSQDSFRDCMEKLKKLNPTMELVRKTQFSKAVNTMRDKKKTVLMTETYRTEIQRLKKTTPAK